MLEAGIELIVFLRELTLFLKRTLPAINSFQGCHRLILFEIKKTICGRSWSIYHIVSLYELLCERNTSWKSQCSRWITVPVAPNRPVNLI
jgi:hypothetical protein